MGAEIILEPHNEMGKLETIRQIQDVMESLNTGVVVITVDDDARVDLIFVNDRYFQMIGYSRQEFFEKKPDLFDMIHPEDREKVIQSTLAASHDKKSFEMSYRILSVGRGTVWCESKIVVSDITGIALPVQIVVLNDVTEKILAEEERRIHAEEMRIAIEQMGKLICEFDVQNRVLHIPETYANWYGLPMPVTNVPYRVRERSPIAREYLETYIWFYEEIMRGVRTDSTEVCIQRLDGSLHWEHYEFKTIFDSDGVPVKAIIIIEDITEQHEAKQEYEREHKLRHELMRDALIYYKINLTTGVIEEYYSRLEDVPEMYSSVAVSDEVHQAILKNILPEYHEAVSNNLFSDSLRKMYKRGENTMTVEYRRMMPMGGSRWVKAIGNITDRPGTGEAIAFIHVHDIEIEKKNQLALNMILSQRMEAMCIVNIKDRTVRLPSKQAGILVSDGYRTMNCDEHIMGRAASAVAVEDRNKFLETLLFDNVTAKLSKGKIVDFSYWGVESDGSRRRKRTTAYYVDESHEDIVLCRSDITNLYMEEQQQKLKLQRAAAEATKANSAKDEFLSRMSHDMRTPLNAILSLSSQEMINGSTEAERSQWFFDIHSSGEYLLGLINDVLDVSRIESHNLRLVPEPFLITDFQRIVETAIGPGCKEKNIEFTFDCKYIEYPWIMTDKTRFNQIFINLLSNAVKYTPQGGKIELEIETIGYDNDKPLKQFTVRDNGIGMSKEFLPHAFDSFSQELQPGADPNNQGAGLGLSIVKHIVELMGGTITVKSHVGKGTEFTIILPLDRANPVEETAVDEKILQKLEGRRILICEDHTLNAKITAVLLEKRGCISEIAENGKVGLEMFRASETGYYDAILMDIRMPVMDGLEATATIRELKRRDAQRIPIIALTADVFTDGECIAQGCGMSGYLTKPIDTMLMYEMIASQLS